MTASGSDTDTISLFRLDTKDSEILGAISATDFNVSYHTSLSGAQTSATTDVIDKTIDHAVTVSQTIFVRVENVDQSKLFRHFRRYNWEHFYFL